MRMLGRISKLEVMSGLLGVRCDLVMREDRLGEKLKGRDVENVCFSCDHVNTTTAL